MATEAEAGQGKHKTIAPKIMMIMASTLASNNVGKTI